MITSSSNPHIKQIRKLRERKERLQSGLFLAEGLRIVGEAVERNWPVEQLVFAPELLTSEFGHKLVKGVIDAGGTLLETSGDVFRTISGKENPQGIAAVVQQRWEDLSAVQPGAADVWIALDSIADPGNLGTIMRTGDAVGAQGVILLDHSTDPYDPSAIRASMGAVFSQRLVRAPFEEFVQWKKKFQLPLIGTSDKAESDYHQYHYPAALTLLMGSERQGLQENHLELCDAVVRIPMAGRSDSLNLAVATAVVLYEVYNQHRDLDD